ncbi:MAG: GNAT family N-acetyltransferase, partial [Nitrospiraceae bacterium]
NTYYFFQAGFDPDWYPKSVGLVLKATIMRHLIESGVQYYDFLAGGDDYRLRWGPELRSYLSLRLARSFSRGGFSIRLIGLALSVKEALRRHIPASAWAFLRRSYRRFRPLES